MVMHQPGPGLPPLAPNINQDPDLPPPPPPMPTLPLGTINIPQGQPNQVASQLVRSGLLDQVPDPMQVANSAIALQPDSIDSATVLPRDTSAPGPTVIQHSATESPSTTFRDLIDIGHITRVEFPQDQPQAGRPVLGHVAALSQPTLQQGRPAPIVSQRGRARRRRQTGRTRSASVEAPGYSPQSTSTEPQIATNTSSYDDVAVQPEEVGLTGNRNITSSSLTLDQPSSLDPTSSATLIPEWIQHLHPGQSVHMMGIPGGGQLALWSRYTSRSDSPPNTNDDND